MLDHNQHSYRSKAFSVMLLCWHTCARTFPSLIPITHFSLYRLESILTSLYLLLRAFRVTGSWEAEVLLGFLER